MAFINSDFEPSQEHKQFIELLTEEPGGIFYLTGPAGSGKSTLIDYLRKNVFKFAVVAAPTGIAAVNVRGQTLHSLFQLPLGPILPNDERLYTRYFVKPKLDIFRNADIIIIDEISMVRADTLDAVDTVLRRLLKRNEPFAGKKLLMVGDVFQLEPIVTKNEGALLAEHYESPFFFDAQVLKNNEYSQYKLRKIYRQTDERFKGLLNTVKMGESDEFTLNELNQRVMPPPPNEQCIYLCARRAEAEAINNAQLDALTTENRTYSGRVAGDFGQGILPNDPLLTLKPGARVMFLRNDLEKRYVNGTLGTVVMCKSNSIEVQIDHGETVEIEPETWENIKYKYDEQTHTIAEDVIGTFEQFAIKPAWAITIHKSQGLTFDQVHINLGGGAFASGMLYVALSRCRSLEGISLKSTLQPKDFKVNQIVLNFATGGMW